MLCLSCGVDEEPPGGRCPGCGAFLGYPAEGQGFLPQLRLLESGLADGSVGLEDSRIRLGRLSWALENLELRWAEIEGALAALPLDEVQQGVLATFLHAGQEALARQLELVPGLDPAGSWGTEAWEALEESQRDILRGHEGVAFLMNQIAGAMPPPG